MRLKNLAPRLATLDTRVKELPPEPAWPSRLDDRRSASQRGYGVRWRRYRLVWLRKHPLCGDRHNGSNAEHSECAREGRAVPALVVDHIKPHRDDQVLFWDPTNHQSLCKPCHDSKTATEDGGFGVAIYWPRIVGEPSIPVTLVAGPPAAGKSTYVRKHRGKDDLVIDLDDILIERHGATRVVDRALRHDALMERNRRLQSLVGYTGPATQAWFLTTAPKATQRAYWSRVLNCRVLMLLTPLAECVKRVSADPHRSRVFVWQERIINRWWAQYTAGPKDIVIYP